MVTQAHFQLFSVADRDAYRWVWGVEPPAGQAPKKLWLSARFAAAERALSDGSRAAFAHGCDEGFAWAFAAQVAENRAADGREHVFTHLIFCPLPCVPELLEYALLRNYDGSRGLADYVRALFAETPGESALVAAAASVGELVPKRTTGGANDIQVAPSLPESKPSSFPLAAALRLEPMAHAAHRSRAIRLSFRSHLALFALIALGTALGQGIALFCSLSLFAPRANGRTERPAIHPPFVDDSRQERGGAVGYVVPEASSSNSSVPTPAIPASLTSSNVLKPPSSAATPHPAAKRSAADDKKRSQ